jgi:hypothetical protein
MTPDRALDSQPMADGRGAARNRTPTAGSFGAGCRRRVRAGVVVADSKQPVPATAAERRGGRRSANGCSGAVL